MLKRIVKWFLGLFGRREAPAIASKEDWLAYADRLYANGVDVFNHSTVMESAAGTQDPKVVGLTLLARTLNTFKAATKLLDSGHVVEARTLTRCCWENLFWIAALTKKGDEFVKAMELDDAASRMKRASAMLRCKRCGGTTLFMSFARVEAADLFN